MPRRVFDYEIIDCIGQGAGSLIYVVSHEQTHQLYALKHVVKREEKDARFIEQLENEYQISRQFKHPALRRAIEMRDDKTMFKKANQAALVMELFDGGRWRGAIAATYWRRWGYSRRWPKGWRRCMRWAISIAI